MGTRSPNEPAPAYNDLFEGHERPSNNMSGYNLVPAEDNNNTAVDIEQHVHSHSHSHSHSHDTRNRPEQMIIDLPPPGEQAHFHCEACDRLIERKQKRANERHCCTMVAVTFIVAFLCLMILGIVIVRVAK